jgi:hypothetical protein
MAIKSAKTPCLASRKIQPEKLSGATDVAERMRELKLANVRVINLPGTRWPSITGKSRFDW